MTVEERRAIQRIVRALREWEHETEPVLLVEAIHAVRSELQAVLDDDAYSDTAN